MNVRKIDRTATGHGDYKGLVELTYDEIVLIRNALYKKAKVTDGSEETRYSELYKAWCCFGDMVCYGKILPPCGAKQVGGVEDG